MGIYVNEISCNINQKVCIILEGKEFLLLMSYVCAIINELGCFFLRVDYEINDKCSKNVNYFMG